MNKKNLAIDAAALTLYLIAANPAFTGIGVHEWFGLGVLVVFFVHVAVHVDWLLEAVRDAFLRPSFKRTGSLVLSALMLIVFLTAIISGLLVSGAVLPTMGLFAPGYYFWDPLHAVSAKALLALLLVHVFAHWDWIVNAIDKRRKLNVE